MATTSTTKPLGGYAVTSVKQHEGRDGVAFSAVITKDGKKIIHVRNEGCGGCNTYDMVGPFKTPESSLNAIPAFRADLAEFEAFAASWNEGNEFAGIEDGDAFVEHLMSINDLSRMRRVVFLLDDQDYFDTGVASAFPASTTYDQAVATLCSPQYAARNPRVWDKSRSEFVPVV
jgi:hypothetical protein